MIFQRIPQFDEGNVLSKEMLDEIKNRAFYQQDFIYLGYANGIIKGCDIVVSDEYLLIQKGSFSFENQIFYISEDTKIPYKPCDYLQILVIRVGDIEHSRQFESRSINFVLIKEEDRIMTDMEICRFSLQSGASLRHNHRNFADMMTVYDTLCICYAQWASYKEVSIALPVLAAFADEAKKCKGRTPEDNDFIRKVLSSTGETLPFAYIKFYLENRLGKEYTETLNPKKIYNDLTQVLGLMKDVKTVSERRSGFERKIMVD